MVLPVDPGKMSVHIQFRCNFFFLSLFWSCTAHGYGYRLCGQKKDCIHRVQTQLFLTEISILNCCSVGSYVHCLKQRQFFKPLKMEGILERELSQVKQMLMDTCGDCLGRNLHLQATQGEERQASGQETWLCISALSLVNLDTS